MNNDLTFTLKERVAHEALSSYVWRHMPRQSDLTEDITYFVRTFGDCTLETEIKFMNNSGWSASFFVVWESEIYVSTRLDITQPASLLSSSDLQEPGSLFKTAIESMCRLNSAIRQLNL